MVNLLNKEYLAAYLVNRKKFHLKKMVLPVINDYEIIVKVKNCSICGSDLKIYNNGTSRFKLPQITGHEISGQIVKLGKKIKKFKIGDKISIGADIDNKKNLAIGHEIPGGFSQYMILNKLVSTKGPIEKFSKINYKQATLAEPLGCCINGFEKSNVKKNKTILIIGGGPIGLILSKLSLLYKPKKIFLIEKSIKRLKLIKKITNHIDMILGDNIEKNKKIIYNLTENHGVDYIFTANSNDTSQTEAFNYIGNNGVINFFGGLISSKNVPLPSNDIHYKQLKVVGSHGCTNSHHREAVRLLDNKKIDLDFIISHQFTLNEIDKAFKFANKGNNLKITITPN